MNENYLFEKWADIKFDENISNKETYQISTYGRVRHFKIGPKFGTLMRLSSVQGYKRLPIFKKNGKTTTRYIHKLVAQTFIEKTNPIQQYVIHLDYNKENNLIWNLMWATKQEKEIHQFCNPRYKNPANKITHAKLTEGQVKIIKRKLNDPNRKTRIKMIAKQYGVSEMQLHRIRSGKSWSYVTID
jgi:hypothetical protein